MSIFPVITDYSKAADASRTDTSAGAGQPILKLSQVDGSFSIGAESEPVEHGTEFVVIPSSFQHGWICWVQNRAIGLNVTPMWEPLPVQDMTENGPFDATDSQEGWSRVVGIQLVNRADGEAIVYKPSSMGGRGAVGDLFQEWLSRAKVVESDAQSAPVIALSSKRYYSSKRARHFFNPVFTITEWLGEPDVLKLTAPESETPKKVEQKRPSLTY